MSRLWFDVVLVCLVMTLSDVIVVAGIFYKVESWDLVWLWHLTLFMYAVLNSYLLSFYYNSFIPVLVIFVYFYFQIEDVVYMVFSSLLGWEDKPWLRPDFRWTWLDTTISGFISRLLGYEGATTTGVILSAVLGIITIFCSRRAPENLFKLLSSKRMVENGEE